MPDLAAQALAESLENGNITYVLDTMGMDDMVQLHTVWLFISVVRALAGDEATSQDITDQFDRMARLISRRIP